MDDEDYARIARVIAKFHYPERREIMQRFAYEFLSVEPKFDLVVFARECRCGCVEVPVEVVRLGEHVVGIGQISRIERLGPKILLTYRHYQEPEEFHCGETVILRSYGG
jgi:hypothetical protein